MSDDVKGVFVRLPLREEQLNEFHHTVMYCEEEAALRTIGTPVADGELYPIGYIGEEAIGGLACGIYQTAYICRDKDADHHNDIALTRMSEALAKLAEKDAEIARLREALRGIIYTAHNLSEDMCIESMQKEAEAAMQGTKA